jgi:hypothetical protein
MWRQKCRFYILLTAHLVLYLYNNQHSALIQKILRLRNFRSTLSHRRSTLRRQSPFATLYTLPLDDGLYESPKHVRQNRKIIEEAQSFRCDSNRTCHCFLRFAATSFCSTRTLKSHFNGSDFYSRWFFIPSAVNLTCFRWRSNIDYETVTNFTLNHRSTAQDLSA